MWNSPKPASRNTARSLRRIHSTQRHNTRLENRTPTNQSPIAKFHQGVGQVNGYPNTLDSIIAERGGFLGPLYTAYQIAHKYNITHRVITIHIHNIGSYTTGDSPKKGEEPLQHLTDDYRRKLLKQECTKLLQDHNIYINWCHVKSHQDLLKKTTKRQKRKGAAPRPSSTTQYKL